MLVESEQLEKTINLTAMDRCDSASCGAQAYVVAVGVSGELMFCSHHYNKILSTPLGQERLENFAYQIIDERDRLIENRLVGEN